LADDLLGGIAGQVFRSRVPRLDHTLRGIGKDRVVRRLDDRGEPSGGLLRALALSDVDRDPRHADQLPVDVPRHDRSQNVDDRAVLALTLGLVLVGGRAAADPVDVFVNAAEQSQLAKLMPDRLVGAVAVQLLRAVVPVSYPSVEVDRQDRVGAVLGRLRQPRELPRAHCAR